MAQRAPLCQQRAAAHAATTETNRGCCPPACLRGRRRPLDGLANHHKVLELAFRKKRTKASNDCVVTISAATTLSAPELRSIDDAQQQSTQSGWDGAQVQGDRSRVRDTVGREEEGIPAFVTMAPRGAPPKIGKGQKTITQFFSPSPSKPKNKAAGSLPAAKNQPIFPLLVTQVKKVSSITLLLQVVCPC